MRTLLAVALLLCCPVALAGQDTLLTTTITGSATATRPNAAPDTAMARFTVTTTVDTVGGKLVIDVHPVMDSLRIRYGVTSGGGGTPAVGIPFGPYSAWSATSVVVGAPYTVGMGTTAPQHLPGLLVSLEAKKLRAFLNLFGGGAEDYITAGRFDMAKWEAKLAQYTPHVEAIRAAYWSGLLRGLVVLDEPHNPKWGGGLTGKAMVDSMCGKVRDMFGIPAGVTHQPDLFHPSSTYRVCDFLINQYVWRKPAGAQGNVALFLEQAKAYAARDGIAMVFSLNILNGGVQAPRDGLWRCDPVLTGGRGTDEPNCRMTAAQVREYGLTLGPWGCALLMWRYDPVFMGKPDNAAALRDVASRLATLPAPEPCTRGET